MKHILTYKLFEGIDVKTHQSTSKSASYIIKKFDLNLSSFFNQGKYELSKEGKIKMNSLLSNILKFLESVHDEYKIMVKVTASESPSTPPKGMKYGDLSKLRATSATNTIKNFFNTKLDNPKVIIEKPNIIIPNEKDIQNYKTTIRPKLRQIMNSVDPNNSNAIKVAKQKVAEYLNKLYKDKRFFKVEISVVGKNKVEKPDKPKEGIPWNPKFKFKSGKPYKCKRNGKTISCRYLDKQHKKRKKNKRY